MSDYPYTHNFGKSGDPVRADSTRSANVLCWVTSVAGCGSSSNVSKQET
jgi:hypothetical protein